VLECIISSKDISRNVRGLSSGGPIGVVTCRLKINAQGVLRVTLLDEARCFADTLSVEEEDSQQETRKALAHFLDQKGNGNYGIAFSSDLKIHVSDSQVLRTTMKRIEAKPVFFEICPPAAGEQRITNLFNFSVLHNAVAASFPSKLVSSLFTTSMAHSLRLNAGYIDVLVSLRTVSPVLPCLCQFNHSTPSCLYSILIEQVYIAQSSGGVSEAVRATVIPILELLKTRSSTGTKQSEVSKADGRQGVQEVLLNAPFICSIHLEGIRATW